MRRDGAAKMRAIAEQAAELCASTRAHIRANTATAFSRRMGSVAVWPCGMAGSFGNEREHYEVSKATTK
jgi:hypothetical protein